MSKEPIHVTLSEDRRKAKPWTWFVGKPDIHNYDDRFTRKADAKRGAARKLGAYAHRQYIPATNKYRLVGYKLQDGRELTFTTHKPKR